MNYETFYSDAAAVKKTIKEKTDIQNKGLKRLAQYIESGDLPSLLKLLPELRAALEECEDAVSALESMVENFDIREYITSGDFEKQILECCREQGVDIKGERSSYEIFPYSMFINGETLDVTVDRKRVSCYRPSRLIGDIKTGLSKLSRASFNAAAFAKELVNAYDLALLRQAEGGRYSPEADYYLINLYDYLTPMRRFKKDYDKQNYAYDLARLYASDYRILDDGRSFQFGPSRNNKKAVRILDQNGVEQYIATIRFFKKPGMEV